MPHAAGPFRIEVVGHAEASAALHAVREQVFVQEQAVPAALERDALDPLSRHVLARDADGRAIGTARLAPDGKIGRMAVLRAWRGQGVGAALLHALLGLARDAGLATAYLHAQAGAIDFYRRHGFAGHGERFEEAGIEHLAMRLRLDRPLPVAHRDAAVEATIAAIDSARRRLWIRSRALDPGLYDHPRVLDALRRFATAGRGNAVRVLLHDPATVQRAHAPLLALAQRLPSIFAFRQPDDPVDRTDPAAFIASDDGGYYLRSLGHPIEGEAETGARPRSRQLAEGFDQAWERSRPCTELRALTGL